MTLNFNKKGQNFIDVLVVLAVIGIVGILAFTIFSSFNDEVQSDDSFSEVAKNETQNLTDAYPKSLDNIVIAVGIALILSSVIFAYLSRVNTVFGILAIFLLIGMLIIPMAFSNMWEDLTNDPKITTEDSFPITDFIMTYFPLVYLGYIILVGLAWILGDRFT